MITYLRCENNSSCRQGVGAAEINKKNNKAEGWWPYKYKYKGEQTVSRRHRLRIEKNSRGTKGNMKLANGQIRRNPELFQLERWLQEQGAGELSGLLGVENPRTLIKTVESNRGSKSSQLKYIKHGKIPK